MYFNILVTVIVAVMECDVLKMSEKMNSVQNISKITLDFETKLKFLGPARPQLKIVQVQNECSNKKA